MTPDNPFSCTTTSTSGAARAKLDFDAMLDAINKVRAAARQLNQTVTSVHKSPYATKAEPVRLHKKRRSQSASYHRRIQKKWTKRWGVRQVPCAYMIDNRVTGGHGRTLVVHPSLMAHIDRSG